MDIHRPVENSFWWNVAQACDYATFFHSPLWHRLIERTFDGCEDRTVGAVTDDGVRMVLPLLKTGESAKGMMEDLTSTYAGCYGGVIADGEVSEEDVARLYDEVQTWNMASLSVNGNPMWSAFDCPSVLSDEEATGDFTQIIELGGRTFDDVLSDFSRGHRSSMNKGQQRGVEIRQADSLEDYRSYFGAYEDCLRRWDNPSSEYPWELFENGFEIAQQHPGHISLWLAEVDGEVVGGAWFFYWNQHLVYWHGATYEEYFDYRTNNVLHPAIIKDAIESGYKYYDFNPSGGHEGVVDFKRRFGPDKWPIQRWRFTDQKLDYLRRVRSKFSG